jgi:transglutaminase-like putative cysteine protease
MLLTAGYALAATHWAPGLGRVPAAAFAAGLLGWILAHSRLRPRASALLAAGYGLTFVFWALFQESQLTGRPAGIWLGLHLRTWLSLARLAEFFRRLYTGAPNNDLLIFTLAILWATWILASLAAWSAFRLGRFWAAFLPTGIGVLAVAYFYSGQVNQRAYLALYLLFGLLLLARFSLQEQTEDWRTHAVNFTGEVSFEFARMGLLTTLAVLVLAWSAAGRGALRTLEQDPRWGRTWDTARESFTRLFGELQAAGPGPGDYYGQSLALGGAVSLSPAPVFEVTTSRAPQAGRFYWRAAAYDHYENGRWQVMASLGRSFDPRDDTLRPEHMTGRLPVEARFTVLSPSISRLYLVSEPVWVDRPLWIESDPDGLSVASARAKALLPNGTRYLERSAMLRVDQSSLRAAGQTYSRWIRDHYLQLPASVTSRTRDLAYRIAGDLPTAYDKALAVTRYLREAIEYEVKISPPPTDSDPVDWVLFDSPRGYCNYYASAEVVLLRALGIPARLAVGFSQGEADASGRTFVVRESGAHAWPEVYFPNLGWVEFEPTASEPELVRPAVLVATSEPAPEPDTGSIEDPRNPRLGNIPEEQDLGQGRAARTRFPIGLVALAVPAALLVLAAAWGTIVFMRGDSPLRAARQILARVRRTSEKTPSLGLPRGGPLEPESALDRAPLTTAERAYAWTRRLSDWHNLERGPHLTPLEHVARLKQRLPELAPSLDLIARHYTRERYGAAAPAVGAEAQRLAAAQRDVVRHALPLVPQRIIHWGLHGLRLLRGRV